MKWNHLVIGILFLGIISSCQKDDDGSKGPDSELQGKYKLVEVLSDPGDGSGTFQPVESEKKIYFYSNNLITSNGDLCDISIEADVPSSGTYSLEDSTFSSANCVRPSLWPNRFIVEGSYVTLIYPCYEGCLAKYEKFE